MSSPPRTPQELADAENDREGTTTASMMSGVVLGFAGVVIMLFGLPLAVALPAGLIWGKNKDIPTILALFGVSLVGLIFVYAASLLIGAAMKSLKRG